MKFANTILAAAVMLGASIGVANANTFALGNLPTGQIENPGAFSAEFFSSAADSSATFDFQIAGFNTLDGVNGYQDLFTFTVNNVELGSGSFNLGGGGTDFFTWTSSQTGTYVNSNASSSVTGNGGTVTFSGVVFGLNAGINTVEFKYAPVQAGPQGVGDES